MSNHRFKILNGPAEKRLDEIANESIDCCFTSPQPFKQGKIGVGSEQELQEYLDNLLVIFRKVKQKLKPSGSLFVHMGDVIDSKGSMMFVPEYFAMHLVNYADYLLYRKIVWHKTGCGDWDFIFWFLTTRDNLFLPYGRSVESIWAAPIETVKCEHCNEYDYIFPKEIIEKALWLSSLPSDGGIVLDPMCGLGCTTGLAALGMGYKFIGIELDTEKAVQAMQRLKKVTA